MQNNIIDTHHEIDIHSRNVDLDDIELYDKDIRTTPMMRQYLAIKNLYKEHLLFYRLGDFYEMFFDDALLASRELDIVLTQRVGTPMCGIPAHAAESYLQKLIRRGYSIALCEQLEKPEDAKKRGSKAVVKRDVVRIITPGTVLEESLLNPKTNNYICSIHQSKDIYAIAWLDVSTGEFYVSTMPAASLNNEVSRILPSEIIISDGLFSNDDAIKTLQQHCKCVTRRPDALFDITRCEHQLKSYYGITFLSGIGTFSREEIVAAGALLEYVRCAHKENTPKISPLKHVYTDTFMSIDAATRINLAIFDDKSTDIFDYNGTRNTRSLLSCIDITLTASGGRLLRSYLASPLTDANAINIRLDNIENFYKNFSATSELRLKFKHFPDIERILARISSGKALPYDIHVLCCGLQIALDVAEFVCNNSISNCNNNINSENYTKFNSYITSIAKLIASFDNLIHEIRSAIGICGANDDTSCKPIYSSFIRTGYNARLDNLYETKRNADKQILLLCTKYKQKTGISTLKITRNNVLGYFIEVTASNADKMNNLIITGNSDFIHRQSLAGTSRYTTQELKNIETELLTCDARISTLESEIFTKICSMILDAADQISLTAQSVAYLDAASSLATLAIEREYTRPIIDDSLTFEIKCGRHPIVEKSIGSSNFTSNDCTLNGINANDHISNDINSAPHPSTWIITGPNMSGKSTFLRQNAIICVMAHIGSFVPAKHAHIGIVDKLFCRVGADDNIMQGRSTFMVEMLETAYILNNATSQSFIIFDEVGRGTSTHDGLAIAWAVIEGVHKKIGARMLFATHYHELTKLEDNYCNIECHAVRVNECGETITFTHKMIRGRADKSYGIHVAMLAGVPSHIIKRANEILIQLDCNNDINKIDVSKISNISQKFNEY